MMGVGGRRAVPVNSYFTAPHMQEPFVVISTVGMSGCESGED